jgi:integrase
VYEVTLRQRLASSESVDAVSERDVPFETFAQKWFETHVVPNNKYSEQRHKKYVLSASLVPFFGKMKIGEISSYDIERYKAKLVKEGVTNKTIKNHLTVLNKLLKTAYEWLKLGGAPPKIVWPKCASYRTDYLSPEECELLLSHAHGLDREMILMALRTGMRQGELKGLQWSAIDWQNHSVAVRHSRCDRAKALVAPKNGRERHVPLDNELFEVLCKRKRDAGYVFLDAGGQPFNHKRLVTRLARVCRRAGVRRVTWHVLRHTFASHLAIRGVPLHVVQQLLGHTDISTTLRYAHVAPSALRTAVDLLSPKTTLSSTLGQPVVNPWFRTQQRGLVGKEVVEEIL